MIWWLLVGWIMNWLCFYYLQHTGEWRAIAYPKDIATIWSLDSWVQNEQWVKLYIIPEYTVVIIFQSCLSRFPSSLYKKCESIPSKAKVFLVLGCIIYDVINSGVTGLLKCDTGEREYLKRLYCTSNTVTRGKPRNRDTVTKQIWAAFPAHS